MHFNTVKTGTKYVQNFFPFVQYCPTCPAKVYTCFPYIFSACYAPKKSIYCPSQFPIPRPGFLRYNMYALIVIDLTFGAIHLPLTIPIALLP